MTIMYSGTVSIYIAEKEAFEKISITRITKERRRYVIKENTKKPVTAVRKMKGIIYCKNGTIKTLAGIDKRDICPKL